ncbi:hypothetical protein [Photobacterium leiognathi]|uniref:hypothetical protein n=1 Tax=Photobacterium leiognathi TaxID=553611 RepID=UPI002739D815|nr:hypothetical protein [Photobacterium leiognathi]
MQYRHVLIIAAISITFNSQPLLTEQTQTVKSETTKDTFDDYLKDKERGWYFYESLPEEVKEKKFVNVIIVQPPDLKLLNQKISHSHKHGFQKEL